MQQWLKKSLNAFKYLAFLAAGVLVFWLVYRDEPVHRYMEAFRDLKYGWILVSILLGVLSQIIRALRWNMLISPLGHKPRFINTFLSVLILYFINLLLPRAGEVFRCTTMSRYEKIPFVKLVGTVFVERLADMVALMVICVTIITLQLGVFRQFLTEHPEISANIRRLLSLSNLLLLGSSVILLIVLFLWYRRHRMRQAERKGGILTGTLRAWKHNLLEGIRTIGRLENKWLFISHTACIFLLWLLMLYVVFLAFEPTSHLSVMSGAVTFMMGGLAMLAPVQGGIGPWHFMVYETLFIYGIDKADGKVFALIAHATTNLIYLVLGLLALVIIPLINSRKA